MPHKTSEEFDPQQWGPFLRLGKYLSEDFLKLAEEWLFLVREYGISKVATRPTSQEQFLEFFAHVHDGWKEAQKRIAAFLADALARRNEAQTSEKEQHKLKNKEGQKQARAVTKQVSLEIAVARRMLDVILWTVFDGDHSALRRLHVDGGQHSLSAANIADAMLAADYYNKDAQVMALSTDMLSFVHVGDLIVTNRSEGAITFIELKTGEKNADIATAAEFAIRSECGYFEAIATAEYDEKDRKHYARVKRQAKRNKIIVETILNERGIDPNTGNRVVIHTTPEPIELWTENIMRCYGKLDENKKWAIDVIDQCLYLGVYSDQQMAVAGFKTWMRTQHCDSHVFNLTDSFHNFGVRPLGATFLSLELQQKVLRGEILVIMCLDILKMIDLGNQMRPDCFRLATKAESARLRNERIGNFTLNGRFVRANIGGEETFLGGGFRDRILFDQQRPAQLLVQHLKTAH